MPASAQIYIGTTAFPAQSSLGTLKQPENPKKPNLKVKIQNIQKSGGKNSPWIIINPLALSPPSAETRPAEQSRPPRPTLQISPRHPPPPPPPPESLPSPSKNSLRPSPSPIHSQSPQRNSLMDPITLRSFFGSAPSRSDSNPLRI